MMSVTDKRWYRQAFKALQVGIVTIAILVFLALIILYTFLFSYDFDSQRSKIETYLSQRLDREILIEGKLELQPAFGSPHLVANEIKIANPVWSSEPWFVQAKQLSGSISLYNLLFSEIVIDDLRLISARIVVEKNSEGEMNWPTAKHQNTVTGEPVVPSILNAHVKNLELIIKIKNRPDINMEIPKITASLPYGKPVLLSAEVYYEDVPIHIALQGDTLLSLIKVDNDWPVKGEINSPLINIKVDGKIRHSANQFKTSLQLSDHNQKPSDIHLMGWRNDGIGMFDLKLDLEKQDNLIQTNFKFEIQNFNLSLLDAADKHKRKLKFAIGRMKIHGHGSGSTVNDFILNSYSQYTVENSHLTINPDIDSIAQRMSLLKVETEISPGKKIATRMAGAYQGIPVRAELEHGRLIDLFWSNQSWPYYVQLELMDSRLSTQGSISEHVTTGQFRLKGDNLQKSLSHLLNNPPGYKKFELSGNYHYGQKKLDIKNLTLHVADSSINGTVSALHNKTSEINFHLESENLALNKVLKPFGIHNSLDFNAGKFYLSGATNGDTLAEWLERLNIDASLPELAVHRESKDIIKFSKIKIQSETKGSLTASSRAMAQEIPLDISFKSSPLQSFFTSDFVPFATNIDNKDASLLFRGRVIDLKRGDQKQPAISGSVLTRIQKLDRLTKPTKLKLPAYDNLTIRSRVSLKNGILTLNKLKILSEDMSLAGHVTYQPKKNLLRFILENSQLDIGKLFDTYGPGEINLEEPVQQTSEDEVNEKITRQRTGSPLVIPDVKINVALIEKLNIDADIKSIKLEYKKQPVNEFSARFTVENGVMELGYFDRSHIGSSTTFELGIYTNIEPPRIEMKLDLNNFDYGNILNTLELSKAVAGAVDFDVALTAQGYSKRELLETAKGKIAFVSSEGRVPRRLLELWGTGFFRIFLPTTWIEEETTSLNCAVGRFTIEEGFMHSETLLADTERVTVAGDLAVNLVNESLKGLIKTKSKSAALFKLATPIAVSGTIKNPVTAPAENRLQTLGKWIIGLSDPYALILLFGDLGTSEKNPCAALLEIVEDGEDLD